MILCSGICTTAYAQRKKFKYDFYGFVRGEYYANSRQNTETVDGLFYLLPNDRLFDANGDDLNAVPNGSFYTLTTRLGMNMKGPEIGAAQSSAKIETDFGGVTTGNTFLLRLRQAYVKLDWKGGSSVLLGQTWHPFFGDVAPQVLNLSTGAPFQPFNRSPMVQYQYAQNGLKVKASALYQLIYLSTGPYGKSEVYQKNGMLPELCFGMDYSTGGMLAGAGVEMLSLKPRTQSTLPDGNTFRVNERITTFSCEAHAGYADRMLYLAGKTILASNMNHAALVGGYGVSAIDPVTGEQAYTPFRHSTTWVNAVYGDRWKGGLFGGYTKNLGSGKALVGMDNIYGLGMNLDQLLTASAEVSYQLPHWKLGVECQASTGWYGEMDLPTGKVWNTHAVTNHRIVLLFMYQF
ncbi:MAG: hypothetical protein LBT83_04140 [Tannerella sp.]|jgi:hypothetical protein|nr:hypothetical protein [Tannerella sp.]